MSHCSFQAKFCVDHNIPFMIDTFIHNVSLSFSLKIYVKYLSCGLFGCKALKYKSKIHLRASVGFVATE